MLRKLLTLFFSVGILTSAHAGGGPTSEYFLCSGDQGRCDVVQGANHLRTWNTPDFEYPIAVENTVKTWGAGPGATGREYDLNGNPLGPVYPNNNFTCYDATTDGQHIYTVSWDSGDVVQLDLDWTNPVTLFNSGGGGNFLGITYDPTNDSLWIAQFGGGGVENRTKAGALLSSFNSGIGSQACLALDHADGTLWLVEWTQNGDSRQYSKGGAQLGTQHYAALVGVNPLGGEFPAGGACNGTEFIKKAKCKVKNGAVKKAIVLVKNTTSGQDYTCDLATGQSLTVTASTKAKFTFKGSDAPPLGPNTATVCNDSENFTCL